MTRTGSIVTAMGLVAMLTASAAAQAPTPPPATPAPAARAVRPLDRNELRHQIYVMEGALARAVGFGAQQLNREIRTVAPEMVVLSGEPQARGVYLDGYGVFFDVGVPILHQSLAWSLRTMLGQDTRGLTDALNVLKQSAKDLSGARRLATENAIARLELQIGPMGDPTGSDLGLPMRADGLAQGASLPAAKDGAQSLPPAGMPAPDPQAWSIEKKYLQDPNAINRAYTESVQRALIDAMIDYSLPMAIGPDEFITVGARDNMQRDSLAPRDPYEEVITLLLRLKGSDLVAFRTGQIDRAEARKRVEVREF
jgi:hypothetical protein